MRDDSNPKGYNTFMRNSVEVDHSSITKPASRVMLGGILSLVGSLASNIIVSYIFGAGSSMDAYLTALVIPSYLQIVFFSSLAFVVVPVFIDAESKGRDEDAWALVGTFFWMTTVVLLCISSFASIFSSSIMKMIAPGFHDEKLALASQMLAVLIFTTPFTGLSILTTGIQNARHRFFWPSVAPAFGSFANVVILIVFSSFIGPMALAWGYFLATVIQSCFTIIPVFLHRWKKLLPLMHPSVQRIGKSMVPLVLFGMLTCVSPVASRYFSSGLPDGQIAYMGYANKISSIFVILLASGIAASIFPAMARTYAQEGLPGLCQKTDFGLRLTLAVALPAILIVSAMGIPLISAFFERGAFSPADTYGVSRILFAFLLGDVLIRMVGNVFERGFFTLKNTMTPPLVSSIFVIMFIASARFIVAQWGYVGIVWANVTRQLLEALTIGILLFRKFPKGQSSVISILRYLMAAFASFVAGRLIVLVLVDYSIYIQLVIGGSVSVLLYFLILYSIDKEILTHILELFGVSKILEKLHLGVTWFSPKISWPNDRSR